MRNLLRNSLFIFSLIAVACVQGEDDPEYSSVPYIGFESLEFRDTPGAAQPDSLILTIRYRDGDGDLGLSFQQLDSPYHQWDVFQEVPGKEPIAVHLKPIIDAQQQLTGLVLAGTSTDGRIITESFRNNPEYEFLPENVFPYSCVNYGINRLYLKQDEVALIDEEKIVEHKTLNGVEYAVVDDSFYSMRNENHDNISITFYLEGADGSLEKFEWEKEVESLPCSQNFNNRFPLIGSTSSSTGPFTFLPTSMQTGSITYAMSSADFRTLFQEKKIKLEVSIKDRALNKSNSIETPTGTLDSFKP